MQDVFLFEATMNFEGVLLIDKPKGPSSFDIVRKIRACSGIKRVGHAGTLDPLASGLMVVALGRYTKLCGHLTEGHKVYEAIVELGTITNTDDAEGEILSQTVVADIDEEKIHEACSHFQGTFAQKPPKYSAIKVSGRRAYSMARNEEEFELASREVSIFDLALEQVSLPLLSLRVHCSKGTYIRSLARDIGERLQVGAYARAIRRIESGSFKVANAINFDELSKESIADNLLTGRAALGGIHAVNISARDRDNAIHGRPLTQTTLSMPLSVAFYEENPIAILALDKNTVRTLRVL